MERVEIAVNSSGYRCSEIAADLREVAETLFFPMKSVGYWDVRINDHLCPQGLLGATCPHLLPKEHAKHVDYLVTVERDLDAVLDVYFPHAQVHVYMS